MPALPQSQEELLAEAVDALTEADVPPDEQDYGWLDPDVDPPAELVGLTGPELADLFDDPPLRPASPAWPLSYQSADGPGGDAWPAGFGPRDGTGGGAGFADGGELDTLPAGLALAGFADDAHARAGALDDDSLVGVLRAWRRVASWAQARELAAVAALARRRPADGTPPAAAPGQFPARLSEFIAAEVAAALTLTGQAAQAELGLAVDLADRPATAAALAAGRIDLPRAKIIISMLGPLPPAHAEAVETEVLPRAGEMTTGQLRAALHRAILTADPDAARRRREQAEQDARVEHWADPEGTASLAGRCLPPAQALTASRRLTQIAAAWKRLGAPGGMDLLRAHAYLALLNGQSVDAPPASLWPPELVPTGRGPQAEPATRSRSQPGEAAPGPGDGQDAGEQGIPPALRGPGPGDDPAASGQQVPAGPRLPGAGAVPAASGQQVPPGPRLPDAGGAPAASRQQVPPGLRGPGAGLLPPTAGLINLTVPLTTLLDCGDAPGAAAGHGPLDADTARLLARTLAGHPATRWQITITGPGGQALAHGTARGAAVPGGNGHRGGWAVQVAAEPITTGPCDHRAAEPGYRPGPALRRLIRARSVTCAGPGCRRPATGCDLDHTIAHDDGGITCECNLAPLCRYHHRVKQAEGWRLQQASPGVMTWLTPARRRYTTLPSQHPT